MGERFDAALDAGLAALGLVDTEAASGFARRSYEAHARLLREWNAAINLTAIRDPEAMARRHVCDSLSAVAPIRALTAPGASLLDVGSGSGYPGLPLAAALPVARVGLLDSVGKKARFLAAAGEAVSAVLAGRAAARAGDGYVSPVIEAIAERAEDIAEEYGQRQSWDIVVVRAVGSLAEVLELGLPLAREGGVVVAWKRDEAGGALRRELQGAGSIIRAAGGGRPRVVAVEADVLPDHRLVIVPKERTTPITFPRPASLRRARR